MTDLFIPAANFHEGRRRPWRFIGIHCTQTVCSAKSAENVARFFQHQPHDEHGSSAHRVFDRDSIVQCVHGGDTAWAIPNANADGFHNELCGYASWTTKQWLAEQAMLNIAACGVAEEIIVGRRFGVPMLARYLTIPEIRDPHGPAGLVDHGDCTKAFKTPRGHTDCGAGFPRGEFVGKVRYMISLLDKPGFKPTFI